MPVRVLIVEDQEILRQGIKLMLENSPEIRVVVDVATPLEAFGKLGQVEIDLLLLDMRLPVMGTLDFVKKIRQTYPSLKILVLSMDDNESYLIEMLDGGANGYLLKNTTQDELVFAIKRIAGDAMYMGTELTMSILEKYKAVSGLAANKPKPELNITDRELDVLKLIAEGYTNSEIANKLFTSVRTIETRRKKLLEKTKTVNTATLMHYAVINGLIN